MRAHVHKLLLLWLRRRQWRQMVRRRSQGIAWIRSLRDQGWGGRVGPRGRAKRSTPLFLESNVRLVFGGHGP
ncbi:uncharacterized protein J3R85_000254 [Psidium guajava]|nr:uncharacterized protein J3R85_000254 [Psidium guajava]